MAYKVFTNGSVLQASEVNDNLMKQAVATFSNAAARTAAITSPVEGQLTYLEDVNRYDHWNGSAWVSPFGMTLINTTAFTAQTQIDISNVFSAAYDNYKVVFVANVTTVVNCTLQGRLLASGTPATTGYQVSQVNYNLGTNALQNIAGSTVQFNLGFVPSGNNGSLISFELSRPFIASATGQNGFYSGDSSAGFAAAGFTIGYHSTASSYDGIRFTASAGAITGTLRIYGYRNA